MKPHRRRTRSAVEAKRDRPLGRVVFAFASVGDEKQVGLFLAIVGLHQHPPGGGRVLDFFAVDLRFVFGDDERLLFVFFVFRFGRFLRILHGGRLARVGLGIATATTALLGGTLDRKRRDDQQTDQH
jgi:hypothetical protein